MQCIVVLTRCRKIKAIKVALPAKQNKGGGINTLFKKSQIS